MLIEIISYFNWIRSSWVRHSYFKSLYYSWLLVRLPRGQQLTMPRVTHRDLTRGIFNFFFKKLKKINFFLKKSKKSHIDT